MELDIFPETRMLISEVVRRFKRKKFFNIKPTSHSKFDYEERFKFTIIYGFLNNLIKVSPMVYDDKQEKRAKLMKKANVPITNTIILLNSGIIRKHAENNDESDNRLRKVWVEHIARTMRFERDKLNLILGYGISYLNFQK